MGKRGLNCLRCRKHLWFERTLSNMFSVPPVRTYWCSKCKAYYTIMETETYSGTAIIKAAITRFYGAKDRPMVLSEMTAKETRTLKKLVDKGQNMLSQWHKEDSPRPGHDTRINHQRPVPLATVTKRAKHGGVETR